MVIIHSFIRREVNALTLMNAPKILVAYLGSVLTGAIFKVC